MTFALALNDINNGDSCGIYTRYPLGNSNSLEIKERLYEIQSKIILDWARKSSCVIVGRCSGYILRDEENHINFFIYAPYEARLKSCVEELNMEHSDAVRMMRDVDKARYACHKRHARFTPKDLECNQVMMDSSMLGIDGTAEMLAEIVKRKFSLSI